MEGFRCKQCGTCCLHARFDEVHEADAWSWERTGRLDILRWVRPKPIGNAEFAYEVWIDPVTHQRVEGCPWLIQSVNGDPAACRIYDVRPTICRYFPASRKHAMEVGCKGFSSLQNVDEGVCLNF